MREYDGDMLYRWLSDMSEPQRYAFSAGCLELLVARFGPDVPAPNEVLPADLLSRVTAYFWDIASAVPGPGSPDDLLAAFNAALDDEVAHTLGVGEFIVSGACHAIGFMKGHTAGKAELVARNLYRAAEFTAVERGGDAAADPLVQRCLAAIGHVQAIAAALPEPPAGPSRFAEFRTAVAALARDLATLI